MSVWFIGGFQSFPGRCNSCWYPDFHESASWRSRFTFTEADL